MSKIKDFWQKYETKIVLILGFLLIAGLSFEGGYLKGKSQKDSLLVLEKPAQCSQNEASATTPQAENKNAEQPAAANIPSECMFVGSKNSNKYHLPTCRWAKNIKPENLVCFKSAEDAVQKGYQPDASCIK